jgi:uncharacterized membrane protein YkgB
MSQFHEKYIYRQRYTFLSVSIGIAYVWFGFLKFFPGLSPAESLARDTINHLCGGLIPPNISIILLALWETVLGLLLMFGVMNRAIISFAMLHMFCTFTPFIFFPDKSFNNDFFLLTMVGQYIIKNIIIICALVVLYAEKRNSRTLKAS